MTQLTFAQELSARFLGNERYWSLLSDLRSAGVVATLHRKPGPSDIVRDDLAKLLYCAEVFAQTEDESLHKHAQEIAIHTLLISRDTAKDGQPRERALGLLTELGNFPGLKYVERHFGGGDETLLGLINRRVSEKLSTVRIGGKDLPLTDYQRRVWRNLNKTRASAITAPTSAGKSFLVVEHLCRLAEQADSFAAVYVTPTRALLSEVHHKIQERLSGCTNVRISAVPSLDKEGRPKQIFVLTQERLSTLLAVASCDLAFDLVVVDEAQNIADDARGMILQDGLERIAERSGHTQVILLAPGAVGMPEVAKTFGITDLVPMATQLSPVLQNRIVLSEVKGKPLELAIDVMGKNGARRHLGSIEVEKSLRDSKSRLALVAIELGGDDGSLLYETGPREAEKTAQQLVDILKARKNLPIDPSLAELSKFISEHVHSEYQLASMVQYGVAYHYGRMPSLLREAIENSFKQENGGIRFLVCTTTLAQGVNLPARNVFIDTPKYGAGKMLDPALLWNFVGRAGRLNHDVVGNVFLLNYEKWETKPMNEFVPFDVKSAIAETLLFLGDEISEALELGVLPKAHRSKPETGRIRACAGLMVAHAARNNIRPYLTKVLTDSPPVVAVERLTKAATSAFEKIGLPSHILTENWAIDPFGLKRLFDDVMRKIQLDEIDDLIPMNPADAPRGFYESLFGRLVETVDGSPKKYGALAGTLALHWMKGIPYPVMLDLWVKRRRKKEEREAKIAIEKGEEPAKPQTLDSLIYKAFELIEDVVRFQFVQLGKAYREILLHALRETGHSNRIAEVFDFALALELGISSEAGTAYVELGLSRIAASALEPLAPRGVRLTTEGLRQLLREADIGKLSPIIGDELRRLGLIPAPSNE